VESSWSQSSGDGQASYVAYPDRMSNYNSIPTDQLAWERTIPEAITSDTIWKLHAYRIALYLIDLARFDVRIGMKRGLDREIASQLLRSAASISANIGEGYSRSTRADRLRFLGYALGSLRECVSWYRAATDHLEGIPGEDRLVVLARIRPLLLGLIRSTRARSGPRHDFES
jgi:four helix bundle protein